MRSMRTTRPCSRALHFMYTIQHMDDLFIFFQFLDSGVTGPPGPSATPSVGVECGTASGSATTPPPSTAVPAATVNPFRRRPATRCVRPWTGGGAHGLAGVLARRIVSRSGAGSVRIPPPSTAGATAWARTSPARTALGTCANVSLKKNLN